MATNGETMGKNAGWIIFIHNGWRWLMESSGQQWFTPSGKLTWKAKIPIWLGKTTIHHGLSTQPGCRRDAWLAMVIRSGTVSNDSYYTVPSSIRCISIALVVG